tara:strand:- start:29 stop:457 length:429 start_codon:yes stop_codon:yes gene_type:complete
MKNSILIALIITSKTALAGGKTCKAYLSVNITPEERELGITYYDFVDVLASVGYEATSLKDEAEISVDMGYGTWYRCYDSSARQWQVNLSEALSAEGGVSISYESLNEDKFDFFDKNIFRNPTRKKILKKLFKLAKKLPECN